MARLIVALLVLPLLCSLCQAKEDCGTVRVKSNDYEDDDESPPGSAGNSSSIPSNGGALASTCPQLRNQEQCCSDSMFADNRKKLKDQSIFKGIEQQSERSTSQFRSVFNAVLQYYTGGLFDDFSGTSLIKPSNSDKANITLNTSPKSDNFNATDFVIRLLNRGIDSSVGNVNTTTSACIRRQAASLFNQGAVAAIAQDFALLRNATSTLHFMNQFVQNLTLNVLSASPPSDECVRNLMALTCSKCVQSIPKLCTNVCSAVAKGCFAPYYAALNPQFDIMWNVTAQLVDFINTTLTDLFNQQARVINITQFVFNVNSGCGVDVSSSFRTTSRKPTGIGSQFRGLAYGLLKKGLIAYDQGVLFCSAGTITSRNSCWDGKKQSANDTDDYRNENITGQAMNPVAPFNETILVMQAMNISTPVTTFFNSPNVTAVLPAAITVPQGQTYQGSPGSTSTTSGPADSGTASIYLSIISFIAVLSSLML